MSAEKKKQGFASMTYEQRSRIASLGGKRAHELGKAHVFNSEEAKIAGAKGGSAHSREHMANIGRIGGMNRAANARKRAE